MFMAVSFGWQRLEYVAFLSIQLLIRMAQEDGGGGDPEPVWVGTN